MPKRAKLATKLACEVWEASFGRARCSLKLHIRSHDAFAALSLIQTCPLWFEAKLWPRLDVLKVQTFPNTTCKTLPRHASGKGGGRLSQEARPMSHTTQAATSTVSALHKKPQTPKEADVRLEKHRSALQNRNNHCFCKWCFLLQCEEQHSPNTHPLRQPSPSPKKRRKHKNNQRQKNNRVAKRMPASTTLPFIGI